MKFYLTEHFQRSFFTLDILFQDAASHTQTCLARARAHTHTPQCSCNPARFIIVGVILCPPLREELGEFKLWPTYTLLHFALCSAHKAQCMTSAHTLMFELSEQMALKIKTQNKTSSKKNKKTWLLVLFYRPSSHNTKLCWVNLHISLAQWDCKVWIKCQRGASTTQVVLSWSA